MIEKIMIGIFILMLIVLILQAISDLQKIYYNYKNYNKMKKYKGRYVLIRIIRDNEGKYKDLYYVSYLSKGRFSSSPEISKALFFNNQKEAFLKLREYDWDMSILQI
ncbi:hypothetical protein [uncultured Clostridium sp.]|uniref:hypothetical protein n=1 Tax=uncultured Clostridium sp. TaxID=59620 RepID=UPI00262D631A|nr:hypothetical protein [uncultured Clostridium sp.]